MAKRSNKSKEKIVIIRSAIKKQIRGLSWWVIILSLMIIAISVVLGSFLEQQPITYIPTEWPQLVWYAASFLTLLTIIIFIIIQSRSERMRLAVEKAVGKELRILRSSYRKNQALQEMGSRLRATLNLDEVFDSALNVCAVGLQEAGIPEKNILGAIMLYEGDELKLVARRGMPRMPYFEIDDQAGLIGRTMAQAEPVISNEIDNDPVLSKFPNFRRSRTMLAIPLRVRFQIFGVMLIGSEIKFKALKKSKQGKRVKNKV